MMGLGGGQSAGEVRELVAEYMGLPHGVKLAWLEANGISYARMRRWRAAVVGGDVERGLVPRKAVRMSHADQLRWAHEKETAELKRQLAAQEKENARLSRRCEEVVEALEAKERQIDTLGKAIGLLHSHSAQEPAGMREESRQKKQQDS